MAVSTAYAPLSFNGNDATTAFSVTWPFFTGSLVVTLIASTGVETVKTITTHYTVAGGTDANGLPATGTVTMLTAPASGETLRVTRATPKTQTSTWGENDPFPQKTIEAALDKGLLIAQEGIADAVDEITGDFLQLNTGGATDYFDAETTLISNVVDPVSAQDAATKAYVDGIAFGVTVSAFGQMLIDDADASAARTTLGVAIGSDVQAYSANLAEWSGLNPSANAGLLVTAADYAAMRALLDLEAGTDFNAYNARLADLAGITYAQGDILYFNGTNIVKLGAGTSGYFLKTLGAGASPTWDSIPGGGDMLASNNLSDVANAATAFATIKQAATDIATGVVELATTTEAQAGTDTSRAVTPAGLRSATRERLSANRTYYVRTDGSDSNTGLVDSSGGAFLTINKAVSVVCDTLDFAGYTVTVRVKDGTFTGGLAISRVWTGGPLIIEGNTSTPANCIISTTSLDAISIGGMGLPAPLTIKGFKLQTTTTGYGINAFAPGAVTFQNMDFGAVAAGYDHVISTSACSVTLSGNYTISGGAARHYNAATQGIITAVSMTVTVSGTPAFSSAFAAAASSGVVTAFGQTYSGSATGARYSATLCGIVNTLGGGASYFPGNSVGATATGGQYA